MANLTIGKDNVGSKWAFRYKGGADGQIQLYKACLVAQGYSQKSGVAYNEVFSSMAKYSSISSMLAVANL